MNVGTITEANLRVKKYNNSGNKNISVNKIEISEKEENTLSKQEIDEIKEMLESNYGIANEEIKINEI